MRPRGRAQSRFLLANQILESVREQRIERGRHLVESTLAERLGVSRTLVRASLKILANQSIVEPRRNQGFFLLRSWNEISPQAIEVPPSVEDDLYVALVRDKVDGTIPERITQVALLERYRVDRTVLLRTLSRMAEEGIVVKNKGHGWTFAQTIDNASALRNSYDFRRLVEPALMLLDTFKSDHAALKRIRLTHLAMLNGAAETSSLRLFEIDAEFHETLASFSGNTFFIQAVQQQNRMRRLLEYRGYSNRRRIRDWVHEHVAIIDALLSSKVDLAAKRMRTHLSRAHNAANQQRKAAASRKPPKTAARSR